MRSGSNQSLLSAPRRLVTNRAPHIPSMKSLGWGMRFIIVAKVQADIAWFDGERAWLWWISSGEYPTDRMGVC